MADFPSKLIETMSLAFLESRKCSINSIRAFEEVSFVRVCILLNDYSFIYKYMLPGCKGDVLKLKERRNFIKLFIDQAL